VKQTRQTNPEGNSPEDPQNCPECGSDQIDWDDSNQHGGEEWKEYHCVKCSFAWVETWKFISWEEKK